MPVFILPLFHFAGLGYNTTVLVLEYHFATFPFCQFSFCHFFILPVLTISTAVLVLTRNKETREKVFQCVLLLYCDMYIQKFTFLWPLIACVALVRARGSWWRPPPHSGEMSPRSSEPSSPQSACSQSRCPAAAFGGVTVSCRALAFAPSTCRIALSDSA